MFSSISSFTAGVRRISCTPYFTAFITFVLVHSGPAAIIGIEHDELILSNLAKEVGDLHTELKMITIDFFLGIKKICNPEQSEELLVLFQNLIQNDQAPGGRRGEGRGQGQGQGRRYGWGHASQDDKSASEKEIK